MFIINKMIIIIIIIIIIFFFIIIIWNKQGYKRMLFKKDVGQSLKIFCLFIY